MKSRDEINRIKREKRAADPDRKRKQSEYMRAWRKSNPAAARAIDKRKVERAPEKKVAQDRDYYLRNTQKIKDRAAAWDKANPERRKVHRATRRARKVSNGGILSRDICARLVILQRGKCACCSRPLRDDYELDHIMPLALGGPNTDCNIQLLRKECNNLKRAKHPVEFMQRDRGMLL